ncbi:hypothetical protein [Coleofasciculus sp. E2-BRE-01]
MAVFFFRYINLDEKGGSAIHPPREFIVRSPSPLADFSREVLKSSW